MTDEPRPYHHGRLKRAILDHARRTIATGERWRMSQAAEACGVSSGAPYRHFRNADEVRAQLLEEGRQKLAEVVRPFRLPAAIARATLELAEGEGAAYWRLGLQPMRLTTGQARLVRAAALEVVDGAELEAVCASVLGSLRSVA